jgi:hypothetical protein
MFPEKGKYSKIFRNYGKTLLYEASAEVLISKSRQNL